MMSSNESIRSIRFIRATGSGVKRRLRRAFSLVEILFAIVVLSLGLLGIAAVFPVVITQQQRAQDVVGGAVAATAARGALGGNGAIAELILIQDGVDSDLVLNNVGNTVSNDGFDGFALLGAEPGGGAPPVF
ncbi:MAG: prepilin-type N-terminal cleavage/methylation domain-containing protein [Pseudomonadota bacterium]